MIDTVSTHGRAYTNDPQYQEFFGAQRTLTYYDWGLRAYVKATVQAPKTPRDRVTPAEMPRKEDHCRVPLAEQCAELLREKPMSTAEIAVATEYTVQHVAKFFAGNPAGFYCVGRGTRGGALWGVKGVDYGAHVLGALPDAMERIVAYLRTVGTATAKEICEGAGINAKQFFRARQKHPSTLRLAEVRYVDRWHIQVWAVNE